MASRTFIVTTPSVSYRRAAIGVGYNAGMENDRTLTHFDERGRARMVDVSAKNDTERVAVARATVRMQPDTLRLILDGRAAKGDVLAVAQVAGIMAAKRTHDLIPMCHLLLLTGVGIAFTPDEATGELHIAATVRTVGKTGVEMEALTAATVAALTVYDMVKAADRAMTITDVRLAEKRGGKSGDFHHPAEAGVSESAAITEVAERNGES